MTDAQERLSDMRKAKRIVVSLKRIRSNAVRRRYTARRDNPESLIYNIEWAIKHTSRIPEDMKDK